VTIIILTAMITAVAVLQFGLSRMFNSNKVKNGEKQPDIA
jgi:hypothetical protein